MLKYWSESGLDYTRRVCLQQDSRNPFSAQTRDFYPILGMKVYQGMFKSSIEFVEIPRLCQAKYNATDPATAALSDSTLPRMGRRS